MKQVLVSSRCACVVHLRTLPFGSIAYPSNLCCFIVIPTSFRYGFVYSSGSKRVNVRRRLRTLPSPYTRTSEHLADKMQDMVLILITTRNILYVSSPSQLGKPLVSWGLTRTQFISAYLTHATKKNTTRYVVPGGVLSSSYPWTAGSF